MSGQYSSGMGVYVGGSVGPVHVGASDRQIGSLLGYAIAFVLLFFAVLIAAPVAALVGIVMILSRRIPQGLGILVVSCLVMWFAWPAYEFFYEEWVRGDDMPGIVGSPLDSARDRLDDRGLTLVVEGTTESTWKEDDCTVVSQSPERLEDLEGVTFATVVADCTPDEK